MRFRPPIQNSSRYFSRIKRTYRTQTLTSTELRISSLHSHFWVQLRAGSPFLPPAKTWKFLRLFNINIIIIIIIFNFFFSISVQTRFLRALVQKLTKLIPIGSYSPEVRAFGNLIIPTKVFRLIICKIS